MKKYLSIALVVIIIITSGCTSSPRQATVNGRKEQSIQNNTTVEKTEASTTIHEHSWEPVYKTVKHPAEYTDPWDEAVLIKEAYDEQVLVREAYDEQVLVKEKDWDQVLIKEAWDETIHHEARVRYTGICYTCKQYFTKWFDSVESMRSDLSYKNWYNIHADLSHVNEKGFHNANPGVYEQKDPNSPAWDEVVHHEAEYDYIFHDAEYTTVHHDAEYSTVHHNAEYSIVHHEASLIKEAYTEEVVDHYICSGCNDTKEEETKTEDSDSNNTKNSEQDSYNSFLGAWYGEQGSWFILYEDGTGFYYDGGATHFSSDAKWKYNDKSSRFDLTLKDAGFYLYALLEEAYQSTEMVIMIDRKQSGEDKVWYDELFDRNPKK